MSQLKAQEVVRLGDIQMANHLPFVLFGGMNVLESKDLAFEIAETYVDICKRLGIPYVFKASFDKATDAVFSQVGKLSQNWANFDLARDARFKDTLVASERQALARSIGDQNRALAALGGLSNLAGLPGILVDTMWLLAVCLRTIFQISAIYDRPLTGQQGIAIAYEILAKVDLNRLQEKQTLLAGLGIFEAMTDQSIEEYRAAVLAEEDSQSAMGILTKLEELSTQFNINIEQFNFGFLHKVIPLTAVGLGTAYNNIIINEVIEIAMSVFAPAPKLTHMTEE